MNFESGSDVQTIPVTCAGLVGTRVKWKQVFECILVLCDLLFVF